MKKQDLPSTLKRSPKEAQRTFARTHDSAVDRYGDGERAHRTEPAGGRKGSHEPQSSSLDDLDRRIGNHG